jgi:hypothetical protein
VKPATIGTSGENSVSDSATLVEALRNPSAYDHPVERVEVIETHISWVLLTGEYAYKIKKPVNLGFADFSTLERRRFYCDEELRLNRRTAPDIYLAVVPIGGPPERPHVGEAQQPIEYAVQMRQCPAAARLDRVIARGELRPEHIDRMAAVIAHFHGLAAIAGPERPFGGEQAYQPVADTFEHLLRSAKEPPLRERIEALQAWAQAQFAGNRDARVTRKQQGRVRECHGDLHLENMMLLDGKIVPFDCLEFNERLRWIDVMSDLAFAVMDLAHRGRADFAHRLLDRYLAANGDYSGLQVLPLYLVYRALVRAKVACIRAGQQAVAADERARLENERDELIGVAEQFTRRPPPMLVITRGPSGSGKSTASAALVEQLGAVRVRSDIERKRLFAIDPATRTRPEQQAEVYGPAATRRTYDRLLELARVVLTAGYAVVIDATFLAYSQRAAQHRLAAELRVPFVIVDMQSPQDLLGERVEQRLAAGGDASEADRTVLEAQLAASEPLTADEQLRTVEVNVANPLSMEELPALIERLVERLAPS